MPTGMVPRETFLLLTRTHHRGRRITDRVKIHNPGTLTTIYAYSSLWLCLCRCGTPLRRVASAGVHGMVLLGDLVPGKLGIFVDVMIVFHSVAFVRV